MALRCISCFWGRVMQGITHRNTSANIIIIMLSVARKERQRKPVFALYGCLNAISVYLAIEKLKAL